ncbi:type IV leader peptidase family protein [Burkholderia pseudomallei MSHR5613]|uniref:prepilin peptidase n=1 Tax=Burkholderia pseudomallei TaxID=28450 RepID=UPI0005317CC8|nr:prepilin peptidase [Burkholderia pseudomallei]KGS55009.1 type IV leader peptidase family protein [Burkholderia pseudomallei MSHR5613]
MILPLKLVASWTLASLALADLRTRRLATFAVALVGALYAALALVGAPGDGGFASHAALGAAAFALGAAMFRAGWIAGGDVKLAAVVFLWAGPAHAWPVAFAIGVGGLAVGAVCIAAGRAPRVLAWFAPARGVPYGVALAAGGLLAVWAPAACRLPGCLGCLG